MCLSAAGPDTLHLRPQQLAALEADLAARSHIKFAFDRAEPASQGRLLRAPTPYPKELKELAKHARNLQKLERRPRDALVVSGAISELPHSLRYGECEPAASVVVLSAS